MEIANRNVLILGGTGLVGMAVARALLPLAPARLVISGLGQEEAEAAVAELMTERGATELHAEWGDVFVPEAMKDVRRPEVLNDAALRSRLLDDLYGELSPEVLGRSALLVLLMRRWPEIIIDCINTATAFAYQDIFREVESLRAAAAAGGATLERVERALATLHMPQLIRHVQVLLEGMRRAGTTFYLKVGTSGTGGMGLNVPFTHSEERPSRKLLAKAGVAGAHTLLLYLMARTPNAPAVKEIKPTAAVSWKRIGFGEVRRQGRPIACFDATAAVPVADAFGPANGAFAPTGETLKGVWLDAGENGVFSLAEFETLTALGLMEYITPEEIARDVVREVLGRPTGHDVVAALDASTSGPTYRAGVLRQIALERMEALEQAHGSEAIAFEMLGPPRLSKLLFEGAILGRLFADLREVANLDAEDTARRAEALVESGTDLRVRMLSIGLPVLLRDGERLLRGSEIKVAPMPGQSPHDPRLAESGWVDLRPANWRKWSDRARSILAAPAGEHGPDAGSRAHLEFAARDAGIRPGWLAAWVFREEDRGARDKR
ncbi:MAG: short-chain dehydrogenase [Gemmatimonadetes bacterium]|nr:short-chain dehydrogenase [Gemmatimonadota bacterium]